MTYRIHVVHENSYNLPKGLDNLDNRFPLHPAILFCLCVTLQRVINHGFFYLSVVLSLSFGTAEMILSQNVLQDKKLAQNSALILNYVHFDHTLLNYLSLTFGWYN